MKTKKNNTFAEIAAAFKKAKYCFIAGHINPDGDSIGSTLAVASVLKRMGKKVYPYADSMPGDDLAFLPGLKQTHIAKLPAKITFDTAIFLECSDTKRAGKIDPVFKNVKTIINIDHHKTSDTYGTLNYIDPEASSTAEIILDLFKTMGVKITPKEATCLYTGLVTDTARFLHSNTTAKAMLAGSELLAAGADIKTINKVLYFTRALSETKLLGRALEKMQILHRGTLSLIELTKEDFKITGANPVHTQGIVSRPIKIPGVQVSLLVKQEQDKISVNLRSAGAVDVSLIAQQFGGGGHARAAGFKRKDMPIQTLAKNLVKVTKKAIDDTFKK